MVCVNNREIKRPSNRHIIIMIMLKICKAPTLRLNTLNKLSVKHIMYIEMKNFMSKKQKQKTKREERAESIDNS